MPRETPGHLAFNIPFFLEFFAHGLRGKLPITPALPNVLDHAREAVDSVQKENSLHSPGLLSVGAGPRPGPQYLRRLIAWLFGDESVEILRLRVG